MATSGRSEAENTTAHGSDEGFVRALGLFPATTVNMSQMVGIGPFITIPFMISAMGGRRRSSGGCSAPCSPWPTGWCGQS
jgi:hypothetical protein